MLKIVLAALCSTALLTLIAFKGSGHPQTKETKEDTKAEISFSKGIMPIIHKRCLPCHAADSDNPSLLILESYDGLMKGGKHGSPVKPGDGKGSILVQKLLPDPPFGHQMPVMSKKKLEEEQIDSIAAWIDQGAKDN